MNKAIISLLLFAVISSSVSVQAQTLPAGSPDDSQGDGSGLFFDLTAIDDVTIESLDLYSDAVTGAPVNITIYSRTGTWVGFDASAAGWTIIGSYSRNNNANTSPDTFVLDSPLNISAGQTTGIYVFNTLGGIQHADNCSPPDNYSDASLSLDTGEGNTGGGAFAGADESCMSFAGSVTYSVSASPPAPQPTTAIPTLSAYGLVLTTLGLLWVAIRRLRVLSAKRR